ncbi:MAG TPA: hypothetical protein VFX61_04780, partial [Micromonosporaceae bacterium]|nr:hypothetical protein [Micromonosporaceae bacterium]
MAQRSSSGRGATAVKNPPGNQTPGTQQIRESELAQLRVDDLRNELKKRGVSGISGQRKGELVKTLAKTMRAEQRGKAAPSAKKSPTAKKSTSTATKTAPPKKSTAAGRKAAPAAKKSSSGGSKASGSGSGPRQGAASSRSLKYAQHISSPEEQPSRPGRSLVTTDHEVIQRWAQARNAKPATIRGTEYDGRPGVLRFNFPGFKESDRIREISWNEW